MRRIPTFCLSLHRGLFWYYLNASRQRPLVEPDVANPCKKMEKGENGGYCFRVRYYRCRIAVELFHSIADGTGAMIFLKTLAGRYLQLRGYDVVPDGEMLDCSQEPTEDEAILILQGLKDKYEAHHSVRITDEAIEAAAAAIEQSALKLASSTLDLTANALGAASSGSAVSSRGRISASGDVSRAKPEAARVEEDIAKAKADIERAKTEVVAEAARLRKQLDDDTSADCQ